MPCAAMMAVSSAKACSKALPGCATCWGMGFLIRKLLFGLLVVVCMVVPWTVGLLLWIALGLFGSPFVRDDPAKDGDQLRV